ncbi:MAG: NADH-quinone oxidoreductase subunit C [Desulfobacteraceae bacterium]
MSAAVERVQAQFPEEVVEIYEFRGDTTIIIKPDKIVEICTLLRDDRQTSFRYLSSISAVDYLPASPRFAVVYHLYSHKYKDRVALKALLADDEYPRIHSVVPVWSTANWHERECYDLMGIKFRGHPDLRRILTPPECEGYFPLRKEIPVRGL